MIIKKLEARVSATQERAVVDLVSHEFMNSFVYMEVEIFSLGLLMISKN